MLDRCLITTTVCLPKGQLIVTCVMKLHQIKEKMFIYRSMKYLRLNEFSKTNDFCITMCTCFARTQVLYLWALARIMFYYNNVLH